MGAVGYNSITNNSAQVLPAGSVVNLGHVVVASCAQNISTLSGQTLVVNNAGTYYISVQVFGTASALTSLNLNINGVSRAAISRAAGATPSEMVYEVRGIFSMNKGDVITVTTSGATLTIAAATTVNGYNVSTIVERYN